MDVDGDLDRDGLKTVLQTLVFDNAHVTQELVEERFCILETQPKDVLSRLIIPSMGEQLGDLQCPVFGFWGHQDEMTPSSGATRTAGRVHFSLLARGLGAYCRCGGLRAEAHWCITNWWPWRGAPSYARLNL